MQGSIDEGEGREKGGGGGIRGSQHFNWVLQKGTAELMAPEG